MKHYIALPKHGMGLLSVCLLSYAARLTPWEIHFTLSGQLAEHNLKHDGPASPFSVHTSTISIFLIFPQVIFAFLIGGQIYICGSI